VADADALTLYCVDSIRQDAQQQVCNAIIQQVDLINVQDATVSLCQKSRLENCLALLQKKTKVTAITESQTTVMQQDELINVNRAAVSLSQKPRLEICLALRQNEKKQCEATVMQQLASST
jgi:hypothetical protein